MLDSDAFALYMAVEHNTAKEQLILLKLPVSLAPILIDLPVKLVFPTPTETRTQSISVFTALGGSLNLWDLFW